MLSACPWGGGSYNRHKAGALPKVFQEGHDAAEPWALPVPAGNAPSWWHTELVGSAES